MTKKKKHIPAVAAACLVLVLGSVTAVAAYHYFSPAQVAQKLEDQKLAEAFSGEDALLINETQVYGDYQVTLLGVVAGKDISEYLSTENGIVQEDMIYGVTATTRTDGTPMPDVSDDAYDEQPFFASFYIGGLNPKDYSIMSMGGGYSEFVENGITYRLLEMENIEMFADRGIYLGVSDGSFYNAQAYSFDEATGEISRNESYAGINALFKVPVDVSKADPAAAQEYLEALAEGEESDDQALAGETLSEAHVLKRWEEALSEGYLPLGMKPVTSTMQICTPDAEGGFSYSYPYGDGGQGSGIAYVKELFPENETGTKAVGGYHHSGDMESLCIETFTLNEDGTVTFMLYVPDVENF